MSSGDADVQDAEPQFTGVLPWLMALDPADQTWTAEVARSLRHAIGLVVTATTGPLPDPHTSAIIEENLVQLEDNLNTGADTALRLLGGLTRPPNVALAQAGGLIVRTGALTVPLTDASPGTRALVQLAADRTCRWPYIHLVEQPERHLPGRDMPALIEFMAGWACDNRIVWSTSDDTVLSHLRHLRTLVDVAFYADNGTGPQPFDLWPARTIRSADTAR
ncbi:hypothetical protein [Catellatospora paridis]|uniref:hypothetical protein n=1 Tax=Catellatospora paridis TaxID=1617086 RepID=UPI0012D4B948|nr:hypothetical protein [Catellatospora paridis]